MNPMFNGINIIENPYLTEPGEPCDVKRTWKERLFTRPWNPFKSHKEIIPIVPSREIIKLGDKWIMHPEMAKEIMGLEL